MKITGFFFLLRFLFGSMRSNENAKNEITKWTRFIIPRYRKCRIIRAIVTLAGIRVGQFMSEWLWIISAVGRIKLWYYISSFRPNCHTAPRLVPSLLSLSLFIPYKLHSLATSILFIFAFRTDPLSTRVNKKKNMHVRPLTYYMYNIYNILYTIYIYRGWRKGPIRK